MHERPDAPIGSKLGMLVSLGADDWPVGSLENPCAATERQHDTAHEASSKAAPLRQCWMTHGWCRHQGRMAGLDGASALDVVDCEKKDGMSSAGDW
ncbi:hypothetical protein JG687_00016232 [Phytophthora cactorum]|uniref:Uncharacterized protein n=1 Tax=Phytophthora cactorum TaxID=29920 RepID=A0A329RDI2_9STRA|nr:hypothetical protein JG687_00016232 [Phytophthora cactorum]RAW22747.1 hypothetical protein PC110_g20815 [Phytophthora cactorum]